MDITQEIFLAAWQAVGGYNENKAGFRTWLYRIAANKIIDFRRKATPATITLDELPDIAVESAFDSTLFVREVEAYIAALPYETSRILRLHIYGGYSFPEIAQMLKQPEAKIKSQYYRAIKQVRKEFSDHES
jgi:RNA polymerase sigma-70 factor (ECF subfamily)